jgi:hypothetical protein
VKKVLEQNRRIKNIAKAANWKWDKATIHSIDGDRVNIRLGNSPNLIRNIEVAGDISGLLPTSEVSIVWKNNRPVIVGGAAVPQPSVPVTNIVQPSNTLVWGTPASEGPAWVANTAAVFAWQITSVQVREIMLLDSISWYIPTSGDYELHYLQGNLPTTDWETLAVMTGSTAASMVEFIPTRKFVIMPGILYWFGIKKTTGTCIWGTKNTGSTVGEDTIVTGVYYGSSIIGGYTPAVTLKYRTGVWS